MTDSELRDLLARLAVAQTKTDAQLTKTDAQLAKTDAQLAKTDAQLAKTDAKLDKLAEMYGGIANNQGKAAEAFYYNSLKHNPVLNGIRFDFIEKNVTRSRGDIEEEYDILLVNGKEIYIVEVKYRLHPKDIERMLSRKLANFKKLFTEYEDYTIHMALATFTVEDEVKQMALDEGMAVLQRRGDLIETWVKPSA